jgi:hypothetical protein
VAGLALDFSSLDAENAAGRAKGVGTGNAIRVIRSWVAALFVGVMFASWFDGQNDTGGALHGVTA